MQVHAAGGGPPASGHSAVHLPPDLRPPEDQVRPENLEAMKGTVDLPAVSRRPGVDVLEPLLTGRLVAEAEAEAMARTALANAPLAERVGGAGAGSPSPSPLRMAPQALLALPHGAGNRSVAALLDRTRHTPQQPDEHVDGAGEDLEAVGPDATDLDAVVRDAPPPMPEGAPPADGAGAKPPPPADGAAMATTRTLVAQPNEPVEVEEAPPVKGVEPITGAEPRVVEPTLPAPVAGAVKDAPRPARSRPRPAAGGRRSAVACAWWTPRRAGGPSGSRTTSPGVARSARSPAPTGGGSGSSRTRSRTGRAPRRCSSSSTRPRPAGSTAPSPTGCSSGERGLPANTVKVVQLAGADDEVSAALWQYLLDVDLVARIEAVGRGVATCERTDDEPDLSLGVSELGSLFLGGGGGHHPRSGRPGARAQPRRPHPGRRPVRLLARAELLDRVLERARH